MTKYNPRTSPIGYYSLNSIPKGEVFKRKETSNDVYIKNHYNKLEKNFSCSSQFDWNKEIFIKSNKKVYVGFTF